MKATPLLFILAVIMMIAGCGPKSQLKSLVEEENAKCPNTLEEDVTVTKIELTDNNTVAFYITLGSQYDYMLNSNESKEILREGMIHWFVDDDSPYTSLVDAVISEYATIGCAFENSVGTRWKCEFASYELESARDANAPDVEEIDADSTVVWADEAAEAAAEEEVPDHFDDVDINDIDSYSDEMTELVLSLGINETKGQLPLRVDDGMSMTDVTLTSSKLIYTIECDEDQYNISLFSENYTEAKNAIIASLNPDDDDIALIGKLLIKTNRSLDYKYVGENSRESATIHISNSELRRAMRM